MWRRKTKKKDIEEFVSDEGDCGEILENLLSNITNVSNLIDNDIIPDSQRDVVCTEDDRDDSDVEGEDRESFLIRHVITVGPVQYATNLQR